MRVGGQLGSLTAGHLVGCSLVGPVVWGYWACCIFEWKKAGPRPTWEGKQDGTGIIAVCLLLMDRGETALSAESANHSSFVGPANQQPSIAALI